MLESNPVAKSARICKIAPTRKSLHPNIDDTDTEDDTEDGEAATSPDSVWMDEWTMYMNTVEDIQDGVGLVRWWGVGVSSLRLHVLY